MMFSKNSVEDGVSPVIGVILMVAVTVILAAVIGTFVLDLGSNVSASPQAGVTFSQDTTDDSVTVQIISMENADEVKIQTSGSADVGTSPLSNVGETSVVGGSSNPLATGDRITVVGTLEGKSAVIQTYTYEE